MDLYDAASYHAMVLKVEGRSSKTIDHYLHYQRRFLEFLETRKVPRDLDALNAVNARQWILWLQRTAHGARGGEVSVATGVTVLRIWSSFLVKEDVLPVDLLLRVKPPKVAQLERKPFSRADVNALLQACEKVAGDGRHPWPTRDRAIIYTLLETGVRAGELMGLTIDRLVVRGDGRQLTVLGKGNKERTVPFGDGAKPDGGVMVRALLAYLKEREPRAHAPEVFLSWRGFSMSVAALEALFHRLGDQAGVDNCVPHRLRHSFATAYLTRYPGDETGLRRLMGHVNARTMASYVHLAELEIRRRVGAASPSSYWLRQGMVK